MNPEISDPKFSDSEKNEEEHTFFKNPALNQITLKLFARMSAEPDIKMPVDPELLDLIREVKVKRLYCAERNIHGAQLFRTLGQFLKAVRHRWLKLPGKATSTRYKLLNEAFVYSNLEDAKPTVLPKSRSVLGKVEEVQEHLQVDAWNKTIETAGSEKITPRLVAEAAIALGDTEVKLPPATASSKLPEIRAAWAEFKRDTEAKFGKEILPYFLRLNKLLATSRSRKDNQEQPSEAKQDDASGDAQKPEGDTTLVPADIGNEAQALIENIEKSGAQQGAEATVVTPEKPSETPAEVPADELPAEGNGADAGEPEAPKVEADPGHEGVLNDGNEEYRRFVPKKPVSSYDELKGLNRPLVASYADTVYIGFANREQYLTLTKAGFPSLSGYGYEFDGTLWKNQMPMEAEALDAEVRDVAYVLLEATRKAEMALPPQ